MTRTLTCRCGAVHLQIDGAPMIGAECYCTSCRTAAAKLEALPGAPNFRNAEGGTPMRSIARIGCGSPRGPKSSPSIA